MLGEVFDILRHGKEKFTEINLWGRVLVAGGETRAPNDFSFPFFLGFPRIAETVVSRSVCGGAGKGLGAAGGGRQSCGGGKRFVWEKSGVGGIYGLHEEGIKVGGFQC